MRSQPLHYLLKSFNLSRFKPTLTDYANWTQILIISNITQLNLTPVSSGNECLALQLYEPIPY